MESEYLNHRFGMEFEFTGITRLQTAYTLFPFFQKKVEDYKSQTGFISHRIRDQKNRLWRVAYDLSIRPEMIVNGRVIQAGEPCRVELITPPLRYSDDLQLLLSIIKALRDKGAFVNNTCGIHIHLDSKEVLGWLSIGAIVSGAGTIFCLRWI